MNSYPTLHWDIAVSLHAHTERDKYTRTSTYTQICTSTQLICKNTWAHTNTGHTQTQDTHKHAHTHMCTQTQEDTHMSTNTDTCMHPKYPYTETNTHQAKTYMIICNTKSYFHSLHSYRKQHHNMKHKVFIT